MKGAKWQTFRQDVRAHVTEERAIRTFIQNASAIIIAEIGQAEWDRISRVAEENKWRRRG